MRPTRSATLAGLVLVAVVAPAGAFALAAGDDPAAAPTAFTHPSASPGADDETDDAATEPAETESADTGGIDDAAQAAAASAAGRAHAAAMKAWAHCVSEAASGPKTGDRTGPPKAACGAKPVGPGRAEHAPDATGTPPATGKGHGKGHGKRHPHGRSGAHGH